MRNRTFYNDKHAADYLVNSMIRVNEMPVWVTHVENGVMYYRPIDDKKGDSKFIALDDDAINMMPVPLGFLASKTENDPACQYMKRHPYRQWKIGLTSNTCVITNPFKHGFTGHIPSHYVLPTRAMVDTVLGKYLDPLSAQKLSTDHARPAAFGRSFGVFQNYLLFKDLGEPVGEMNKGRPTLHEDFTYLTAMLNEDLNASGNC